MSDVVLKDFFVSLGWKFDEASAKRQHEALAKTERAVAGLERTERDAHAAGAKRATELAQRAESMAAAARIAGAGIVAFAAGAALALTGLANGLAKSIGEFDRLYYVSGRTGASVNNLKALSYAFEQTGSSAARAMGVLESFAKSRRTNPGVDAMLKSMGVNTKGDASTVFGNAVDAISAKHPYYASAQIAGLLGVSEEDFAHFTKYRNEIKKFEKEKLDLQKSLGVNGDETATAAMKVSRAMGTLHAVSDTVGDKLTQALAPALEKVATGIKDWIEANPEKVSAIIRTIAEAAEWLGRALLDALQWISNEDNQKKIADFWEKMSSDVRHTVKELRFLFDMLMQVGKFLGLGQSGDPVGKAVTGLLGSLGLGGGSGALGVGAIGGASYVTGEPANDTAKPGLIRRGWNAVKRGLGIGESTGSTQVRPPEAAGRYRPVYSLGNADLDQRVVNKIAGEAIANNGESVDAVVNNMLNRVGSKGWGPSGDLMEVALARGQYAGNRAAGAKETEFIRSRIRAIASGGVPDNTNGSNAYRAAWYAGPWGRKHAADGRVVGGNRFAYEPETPNGPYKPYTTPRDVASGDRLPTVARGALGSTAKTFDVNALTASPALGSSTVNNTGGTNVTMAPVTHIKIDGSADPASTGAAVERAQGRANDLSLRNAQTAIR